MVQIRAAVQASPRSGISIRFNNASWLRGGRLVRVHPCSSVALNCKDTRK
jgi:hypothetical protein